jgi:hypothetical protein
VTSVGDGDEKDGSAGSRGQAQKNKKQDPVNVKFGHFLSRTFRPKYIRSGRESIARELAVASPLM